MPDSPVYAFLRQPSLVDYPGHLAAVFFLSGCNFRCAFCHNTELLATRSGGLPWSRLERTCRRFVNGWVDAAVVTGGEPTLRDDLPDLLRFLRRFGWKIKLDTNGSQPQVLHHCASCLDYVAMDIKASLSRYPDLCGFHDVEALTESMRLIRKDVPDYEFRTTVVEAIHTDEHMREIGALIRGARRYVLQPFVPRKHVHDPTLRSVPRTSKERLRALRDLLAGYADDVRIRGDL